jgi:hypothetical protein
MDNDKIIFDDLCSKNNNLTPLQRKIMKMWFENKGQVHIDRGYKDSSYSMIMTMTMCMRCNYTRGYKKFKRFHFCLLRRAWQRVLQWKYRKFSRDK